jgi:hypothetical protein
VIATIVSMAQYGMASDFSRLQAHRARQGRKVDLVQLLRLLSPLDGIDPFSASEAVALVQTTFEVGKTQAKENLAILKFNGLVFDYQLTEAGRMELALPQRDEKFYEFRWIRYRQAYHDRHKDEADRRKDEADRKRREDQKQAAEAARLPLSRPTEPKNLGPCIYCGEDVIEGTEHPIYELSGKGDLAHEDCDSQWRSTPFLEWPIRVNV